MDLLRSLLAGACACLISAGAAAQAKDSGQPVRLIVPFGPGTAVDVIARDIAHEMRAVLDQTIVVENKPGAAGMLGGAELARTLATSTTFMLTIHNTVVINPHLYKNMSYDPLRDFAPVGLVGVGGYALVAAPAAFKSLDHYLSEARAHPGTVAFGSYGVGSGPHMCAEMLVAKTKVQLVHVPFTTGSITSVVGGQVASAWEPYATVAPFLKSGKLVALGASTRYRPSVFPDNVPLLPEQVPGYECTSWVGMFASAKAPQAVVQRMADALARVTQQPAFRERLLNNGFQPQSETPDQLRKRVASDSAIWGKIVSDTGIRLE
jgi:tripartite-type tricarboxylate transporter receptor subunit TctC